MQYLVPGIDLFSDRFRCEGRTLVASLRWVTEELSRGRHNLLVRISEGSFVCSFPFSECKHKLPDI